MEWIIFALLAPFIWSVGSILLKFMRTNYIKSPIGYLIYVTPTTLFSLFLLLFEPFQNPGILNIILLLLIGMIAYIAYALYIYALHKEEVSRATILFGTIPLFVLFFATTFLGEILSIIDYIAFFVIILGTFLISVKDFNEMFRIRNGLYIVLLSCIIFAVHDVMLKSLSEINFSTAMIIRQAGMLILSLLLIIFSKVAWNKTKEIARSFNKKRTILAYSTEIIGMIGMVFFFLALKKAPVSLVVLLGGFQPLFVLALALLLSVFLPKIIKEEINKKTIAIKIVSASLMLFGLYLITI